MPKLAGKIPSLTAKFFFEVCNYARRVSDLRQERSQNKDVILTYDILQRVRRRNFTASREIVATMTPHNLMDRGIQEGIRLLELTTFDCMYRKQYKLAMSYTCRCVYLFLENFAINVTKPLSILPQVYSVQDSSNKFCFCGKQWSHSTLDSLFRIYRK